jgi:hypothetical protein
VKTRQRTFKEVRRDGIAALLETLGPVDTIRFIQRFDLGSGDYTAERAALLGNPSVDELYEEMKTMRSKTRGKPKKR